MLDNSELNVILTATLITFVVAAILMLIFKRSKRKHRYNRRTGTRVLKKISSFSYDGQRINYLRKIDPFVFEELLLDAFKQNGYSIQRNKRYTGDGGIDGIVYNKQGHKFLIQAKRYKNTISSKHVADFSHLIKQRNAYGGFFVHTGRTPKTLFGRYPNVRIISGSSLINLIMKPLQRKEVLPINEIKKP